LILIVAAPKVITTTPKKLSGSFPESAQQKENWGVHDLENRVEDRTQSQKIRIIKRKK
jgi:hypothetical protein